jgi:hypothetical protein
MDNTVIIKITMTDGKLFEIEKPVAAANALTEQITATGYLDPVSGQFYPHETVLSIEIAAPEQHGEGWFSDN